MKVKMRGKRVGIEKIGRASKNNASFLHMPEDTSAVGFVKYLGEDLTDTDLKVGMKVYYGKNRHEIKMDGTEILVMDEDNIYAIAEDDGAQNKDSPSA